MAAAVQLADGGMDGADRDLRAAERSLARNVPSPTTEKRDADRPSPAM